MVKLLVLQQLYKLVNSIQVEVEFPTKGLCMEKSRFTEEQIALC